MSGIASAEPDALDGLAGALRELADRQRRALRQFDLAVDRSRREPGVHGPATAAARSLRLVVASIDELAVDVVRTADAFRSADRVLASLGAGAVSSGGVDAWDLDVPVPGADWEFSWLASGFPFWAKRWVSEHAQLDLELGLGPRVEASAGLGVVDGVLRLGAELEGKFGAWAKAAVASGYGPFVAVASGELFAGTSAASQAAVSVGRNGVAVVGGAGVFAGAKASGEVGLHAGPVGVGASGSATAGIGAKANVDASVGWERVRLRYDLGATLGLGFELGGEFHVQPRELFDGAVDLGDDVLDSAGDVVRGGIGVGAIVIEDTFDTGKDLLGTGKDAFSAGKSLVGGLLG